MKILEITFIPPATNKGGGYLGIYQSIRSLQSFATVDYIGPEFDLDIFRQNFDNVHFIQKDRNIFRRMYYLGKGITTSYYYDFLQCVKEIDWKKYDAVHIDSSRYYFLVKMAKENHVITAVRYHNIEKDYADSLYRIDSNIINFLQTIIFPQNEKKVTKEADLLIFITNNDQNRADILYQIEKSYKIINPVSIERRERREIYNNNKCSINLLITGTLNFGPNIRGILWFVNNVWKQVNNSNIYLTIAGFKPCNEIYDLVNRFQRIKIVDSPEDMHLIFEEADICVAPIFDGAGMKIKVAEALSEGLPVIGTPHAWIGYEKINKGKYLVKNESEFLTAIEELTKRIEEIRKLSDEIIADFNENLSMEHSATVYKDAFCKIINSRKIKGVLNDYN